MGMTAWLDERELDHYAAPRAGCLAGDCATELTRQERSEPCPESLLDLARAPNPIIDDTEFG